MRRREGGILIAFSLQRVCSGLPSKWSQKKIIKKILDERTAVFLHKEQTKPVDCLYNATQTQPPGLFIGLLRREDLAGVTLFVMG